MMVRLIFLMLCYSSSIIYINASTLTFLHNENTKLKVQDAVHPEFVEYAPQFVYPNSTIFQFDKSEFQFYLLSINSKDYYLWIDNSQKSIKIDLSDPEISTSNIVLLSKSNWLSGNIETNNPILKELNQIDIYYANAVVSLKELAQSDDQFRADQKYNTIVWDSRSAKRLYNLAVEKYSFQVEGKWVHHLPAYNQYWQFMYKLYYQNFHVNSFKGQNVHEIKSTIEADFKSPETRILVFHHFFRNGITLQQLKENYEFLKDDLNTREKVMAEALIQKQAVKEMSNSRKIEFLFGIDIDGAMAGHLARDSSERKNVLIFWSTWDRNMATEFNLLADLKEEFEAQYNFIHICIDAYETPEKTKSYIYQNRVGGFHLLPEQSNAFRKSSFRRDLKIRDFPFYVVTDKEGKALETESIPLETSYRLESKLNYFSTKK